MKDITLPIYNSEGKEVDSITLDKGLFEGAVNTAAIYQTIHAYRSNQRKGLAATKTRGEVSGGGKKPWKQKGTGRARAGSTRSPLWRHGGVVFGPHPRDFSYELPKKIKKVALKSVVLAKILENNIVILDGLRLETAKTKDMLKVLSNLKVNPKSTVTLVLLDTIDTNLKRAMGNIEGMNANITKNTNTYEILVARKLLTTKDSFNTLMNRISALAKEKTAD